MSSGASCSLSVAPSFVSVLESMTDPLQTKISFRGCTLTRTMQDIVLQRVSEGAFTHIRMLDLDDTGIDSSFVIRLCAMFENDERYTLTECFLNCNPIGDLGAFAIAKWILKSQSLRSLLLGRCSIGKGGMKSLLEALEENVSCPLEELYLADNPIEDESLAEDLLRIMRSREQLVYVYANRTGWPNVYLDEFRDISEKRQLILRKHLFEHTRELLRERNMNPFPMEGLLDPYPWWSEMDQDRTRTNERITNPKTRREKRHHRRLQTSERHAGHSSNHIVQEVHDSRCSSPAIAECSEAQKTELRKSSVQSFNQTPILESTSAVKDGADSETPSKSHSISFPSNGPVHMQTDTCCDSERSRWIYSSVSVISFVGGLVSGWFLFQRWFSSGSQEDED